MDKNTIAIATISWARNREEETVLEDSLKVLSGFNVPVFITDGGSSDAFLFFLQSLPNFSVLSAKGLWPQARKSITEACLAGAGAILYTEPDKGIFFREHLPELLARNSIRDGDGVVLASRSAAGFRTFPAFQQLSESTINQCCRDVIGKDIDYCYGPFLFNPIIVPQLEVLPEPCGWGWRPFLFAMANKMGLNVEAFVGDFECPPDQREDDAAERIYRMKQLAQNIEGLVLAATLPVK